MANSISTKAFAAVGILPRAKGQRYDKRLFPLIGDATGIRGTPAGSKIEQVGESEGFQGYDPVKKPCWLFAVTLPNGTVVPAYSFTQGVGQNGFMICQDYSFKAKVAK